MIDVLSRVTWERLEETKLGFEEGERILSEIKEKMAKRGENMEDLKSGCTVYECNEAGTAIHSYL